jgi:hypothetical protein
MPAKSNTASVPGGADTEVYDHAIAEAENGIAAGWDIYCADDAVAGHYADIGVYRKLSARSSVWRSA